VQDDLSRAQWRKSSYSGNTGNCVEVAIADCAVWVRDSKNPDGPPLVLTHEQWRALTKSIKAGGRRIHPDQ